MVEKVELKKKYKQLIKARKQKEADAVLEQIWKLNSINKSIPKSEVKKVHTREDLEKLSFSDLRTIGYKVGTKDRSRVGLIREILELQ